MVELTELEWRALERLKAADSGGLQPDNPQPYLKLAQLGLAFIQYWHDGHRYFLDWPAYRNMEHRQNITVRQDIAAWNAKIRGNQPDAGGE